MFYLWWFKLFISEITIQSEGKHGRTVPVRSVLLVWNLRRLPHIQHSLTHEFLQNIPIYNFLSSYEVNIENCQPGWLCCSLRENNLSSVNNLMYRKYSYGIGVGKIGFSTHIRSSVNNLMYRKYSYRIRVGKIGFSTHIRSSVNNLMYRKCSYGIGVGKIGFSTHIRLSRVVDQATTCCLPLHLYMFGLFIRLSPSTTNFHKTSKLSYYILR